MVTASKYCVDYLTSKPGIELPEAVGSPAARGRQLYHVLQGNTLMYNTLLMLMLLEILFCSQDHNLANLNDKSSFFSAHYSITTGYLARAVVNNVLTGGCMTTIVDPSDVESSREMCKIT